MSDDISDAPIAAVQHLPTDMALLKLENETIQSLAMARPRNHEQIKTELIEQLKAYPAFARHAIYRKPVGREPDQCRKCGKQLKRKHNKISTSCWACGGKDIAEGQMKYARGLSIRAAEAIAEAYGYCRVRTEVTPIDDDNVKVEATFTDYQKGRIWQDAGILSKRYKTWDGKTARISDDRFYNVIVKAETSRRLREAICRSVPPGLRSELFERATLIRNELLDDEIITKIINTFSQKGIGVELLEKRLGKLKLAWTNNDRGILLELWQAIEDGETTIAESFDDLRPQQAEPVQANTADEAVTVDDLTGEADGVAEVLAVYRKAIDEATTLRAVTDQVNAAKDDKRLTDEAYVEIVTLGDQRKDEIRAGHAEQSKPKGD